MLFLRTFFEEYRAAGRICKEENVAVENPSHSPFTKGDDRPAENDASWIPACAGLTQEHWNDRGEKDKLPGCARNDEYSYSSFDRLRMSGYVDSGLRRNDARALE